MPLTSETDRVCPSGPARAIEELSLPCPCPGTGTHRSRAMPMSPAPPFPSTPRSWIASARERSTSCPGRASLPRTSTCRAPPRSAAPFSPRLGHQPPTTFQPCRPLGCTARVTSSSAVTTATLAPRHVPVVARPATEREPYFSATAEVSASGAPVMLAVGVEEPFEDDEGEDVDVSSPPSVLPEQAVRVRARAAAVAVALGPKGGRTPPP